MRLRLPAKSLTLNAASLMTATIVTNAFGLVFWAVAAHLRPAVVVGRAAAVVAALTLLATIAQLNLTNVFVRLLPTAGYLSRRLVSRGYLAVIALALVVGTAYIVSGLGSRIVTGGLSADLAFIAAVAVLALFALQDSVLTALRMAPWVTVENISFAVTKLALLPVFVLMRAGGAIALSWVIPAAVAVLVVSDRLFWRVLPRLDGVGGSLPGRRRLVSFVAGEYVGNIFAIAAVQLLPLIIVWRLGAAAAAYFTLPWLISMGISMLLWNVAQSFVVEVAGGHGQSPALLRRSLLLWGGLALGALVVCVAGAGPLLSLAGPRYAAHGATLLRLVGLSAPFTAVSAAFCTLVWLDQRVWALAGFQALCGVALVGGTFVLLPGLGLPAVGWANLGTQVLAAALAGGLIVRRRRVAGTAGPTVGGPAVGGAGEPAVGGAGVGGAGVGGAGVGGAGVGGAGVPAVGGAAGKPVGAGAS